MKKTLLSLIMAMTMVLSMPAAAFAADDLVSSNDTDGWVPATVFDLLGDALMEEKAKTDPTIIIDDEKNGPAATATEPVVDDNMRTVDMGEILADEGLNIEQVKVSTSNIGASRLSNTSGNVTAYAFFSQKATKAKCAIYLQEKYNGSWRTATGVSVTGYIKTVYDVNSITAGKTFTLVKGKVYRAKIVFTDTNSSGTFTKTRYTGSF